MTCYCWLLYGPTTNANLLSTTNNFLSYKDDNFVPLRLTRPFPLHPMQVFPTSQKWLGGDGERFNLAPWGGVGMGLNFLDLTHPTPPHIDKARL